jgi:protein tyrosine/serine phosphatase
VTERTLVWDGCVNVRDLGGHPTPGGPTAFHAVVRADTIDRLTDAGWQALVDYGIRRVIDLRTPGERDGGPPEGLQLEVVNESVLPDLSWEGWAELNELADRAPDGVAANELVYVEFLERFREAFSRAVRHVADAPRGGVLVHCQGGKDRTGLVAALLLRLAGVAHEDIAADYSLSRQNLSAFLDEWIDAAQDDAQRARRARLSESPAESMIRVLETIEQRHGDVAGYLRDAGLDDETIERARRRLLP